MSKKLSFIITAVILSFVVCPPIVVSQGFENSEKSNGVSRLKNQPDFDIEKLSGLVCKNNKMFREEFYSRIDFELASKQVKEKREGEIESIVEQFRNSLDYALGVDFSEEKKNDILSAQRRMLEQKKSLDQYISVASKAAYINEISSSFENFLNEVAGILSDKEFESLFKITKSEIPDAFNLYIYKSE